MPPLPFLDQGPLKLAQGLGGHRPGRPGRRGLVRVSVIRTQISETPLTSARIMASTAISSNCHLLLTSLIKLRRQTRERRQYVYAKSLEAQERLTYERKQQLKDALASGKSLPTELRKQARELGKDLAFDEAQTGRFQPISFLRA
jgi:hypothetical protein